MIVLDRILTGEESVDSVLTLTFNQRQKSRLRTRLEDGEDVGLMLARGRILRDGDLLGSTEGRVIMVKAADENVSTAHTKEVTLFAKACYHLGNRHTPLQIGDNWVRYQQDHVLDELVDSLGLDVVHESAPFEPEAGAYHGSHAHSH